MLTLKIVRDLQNSLSFTEEEHKALEFNRREDGLFWNKKADVPKEVDIGPRGWTLISDTLEKLSKENKLKLEYLDLYEVFCENKSDKELQ